MNTIAKYLVKESITIFEIQVRKFRSGSQFDIKIVERNYMKINY